MRDTGVQAFRYRSARDSRGDGLNVGVFDPVVFGRRQRRGLQSWHCTASRGKVEVASRGYFDRHVHAFERDEFLVRGNLPTPAL